MGITLTSPNAQGVSHSPCPLCGGKDRFAVWVDTNTFNCNQCGIKGGLKAFFETVVGLGPDEAATKARECASTEEPTVTIDADSNEVIDREAWKRFALGEIEAGEELLAKSPDVMAWLRERRGLNEETVRKIRLGLVKDFPWIRRDRCGLRSYQKPDGKWVKSLKIPDGILIRWTAPGEGTVGLQVRCWESTYGRYRSIEGSRLEASIVSFLPPARTDVVILVESTLDAALIHQETAIPVVALGGINAPIGAAVWETIEAAAIVLLLMDNDPAGRKAAKELKATFPNAYPCFVPEDADGDGPKDITDAWRERGLVVDKFITAAIRRAGKELKGRNSGETIAPLRTSSTPSTASPATVQRRAYCFIADPAAAAAAVQRIAEDNETLGIDIKTAKHPEYTDHPKAGLAPTLSRIRLVQVCGQSGDTLIIDAFACGPSLGEILAPLFERKLVAHDGVFVMCHFRHIGLPETPLECCMLQWNALTNETSSMRDPSDRHLMALSFESVLQRVLGIAVSNVQQGTDWGQEEPIPGQLERAAAGVMHLVQLHEALTARLRMNNLEPVYLRMRDAQRVISRMELHGIGFDTVGHAALVARWRAEAEPLERKLRKIMGPDINFDSDKQKSEWLCRILPPERLVAWPKTSSGVLRTTAEVLAENTDIEAIELLLQLAKLRDSLSKYGDNLAAFFNPVTGRIHASFHLTGAVTGRMSSSNPNLHSIPRTGGVRELFTAGPGRVLVGADFSQIDLRVAALLSGDRIMLDAYRRGEDLHRLTASLVLDIAPLAVTQQQRQMAKALNFGTLYGQGGEGLRIYARTNYGVELTAKKATDLQKRLFDAYPQLGQWRADRYKGGRAVAPALTKGGRARSFAEGEERISQMSLNTPVQGTAGEIMLRALVLVDERLDAKRTFVVNTVHDDIMVECPKAEAKKVADILRESMTQAMLEMFPKAPTANLVECGKGKNWGEAK